MTSGGAIPLRREEHLPVPQYLERPRPSGETFGTLRRRDDKDGGYWIVKGDPQAVLLAKRLFPASEALGAGCAKFPAVPRLFPDLVWFLQRWPMKIEDEARFEKDYQAACRQVLRRDALNRNPERSLPSALFRGQLRPFQEEGHTWMLTNRRTLLADEMGLGKTPSALAVMATIAEWPALVVVPPHLIRHWESKIGEFLHLAETDMPLFQQGPAGVQIHTIRGMKPYALPNAHVYLIHYLLLRSWREALKNLGIKTMVFDEVQELRHNGTAKYSAASDLSSGADNVYGLSGTPVYNRGGEIWNVINILEFQALGSYDAFTREWCVASGSDTVSQPAVLRAHLCREGLMIRRRKEDVMKDLPPKRRIVQSIDCDEGQYRELVRTAMQLACSATDMKDPFERGRTELEALRETRQATGIAKAPEVSTFVRGLLEAEEPTLLFVYHHAVVDYLMKDLAEFKPKAITGRETADEKWQAQEAFRKGETNLVLISLRAATGIDGLQERARVVVFAELDWSPAIHSQAEDRAHRDGQRDSVLCYYLVSDVGTDPDMREALGLKVSQFLGLMGDKAETEADRVVAAKETASHMQRVLAKLRAMGEQRGHREKVQK